jgi:hypothetical protein
MLTYRIIGADQKEYGPVSAEQLRQWLAEGRVNARTQVLPEGATEWKALGDLPDFAAAAPGPVPVTMVAPVAATGAAAQVSGPAIGLIVVAGLGALAQVVSMVWNLVGVPAMAHHQVPNQPAWVTMWSGTVGVVFNVIALLFSGLILMGALKMKKLESYGLAMAASIIAMIPCLSPCCLLGLPLGIWAVVVLSKPEVKSAFH